MRGTTGGRATWVNRRRRTGRPHFMSIRRWTGRWWRLPCRPTTMPLNPPLQSSNPTRRGAGRTGLVVADLVAVAISVAVGIALGGSLLAVILFVPAWAMLATSYG